MCGGMDWKKFLRDLGFEGSSNNLPTTNDLKKQWKKRIRETHPDAGGDPKEFHKVMHAYKMLTDSSYVMEHMNRRGPDPTEMMLVVNHVITFEKSFFGGKQMLSWTRVEMSDGHEPIASQGTEKEVVSIDFVVPPGCPNAHVMIFKEKGNKYSDRFGDARLIIHVQPHSKFSYGNKGEVRSTELIPLDQMLCGLEIEVPTMYGLETVKLKPGTKPGQEYRIPRCGVSRDADHVVTIQPLFPSAEDLKKQEWSGLKIEWDPPPLDPDEEALIQSAEDLFQQLHGSFGADEEPK